VPCSGPLGKRLEPGRVPSSATIVEVRCGSAKGDQTHVDVDVPLHAHDVAKQPPVVVDAVGRGLCYQSHLSARRKQSLRRRRRLRPVALSSEVHLGRVDLDEADLLAVSKDDRVAVRHMVDAVRRCRRRTRDEGERRKQAILTIRSATSAYLIVESNLPGGWLQAAGRVRLGPRQTYPVTGGKGKFAHARGTGEAVAYMVRLGQGSRRRKVYRLLLP
jgi:hypothetical protein